MTGAMLLTRAIPILAMVALLTPGPIRLRRFRFSEDSGLVRVPDEDVVAEPAKVAAPA